MVYVQGEKRKLWHSQDLTSWVAVCAHLELSDPVPLLVWANFLERALIMSIVLCRLPQAQL